MSGEGRPSRAEVDPAALELLARHGPQVMATARRWAANPEDAEDAYQRGIEILLTKAPTTDPDVLVPWLKTVVKHEAFAVRRQRERHSPVTDDGDVADPGSDATATHEQAASYERLRQGAEAMSVLKPQEVRALLLKAEGYSYREICEITGWTYTKVNRCLTEGRRAFAERVEGIQAGAECDRLAPVLSALVDGEASAEDLAALRPHLKTCLSCRVRLREFRAAPRRVAALVPPVAIASTASTGGGLRGLFESLVGAAQHKTAALGERAHAAAELAAGQKVAAVAASAAALAGGGTAVQQLATHGPPLQQRAAQERTVEARPVAEQTPAPAPPEPATAPAPAPPAPASEPELPPPPPAAPEQEFDPTAAAEAAAAPAAASPADAAFVPGGPGVAAGSNGGGEFAP